MHRTLVLAIAIAAACGGTRGSPATAGQPTPAEPTSGSGAALTASECTAAGGEVIGDIGDGAIHRPDYRCPKSGEPPIGAVVAEPGQPMAIEGAVCCR